MAQVSQSTDDAVRDAERIYEELQAKVAELGAVVKLLRAQTEEATGEGQDA